MAVARFGLIFIFLHFSGEVISFPKTKGGDDPTDWNSGSYIVEGVLKLPYAEIEEPFTAYYDMPNKSSKISYYGDMVITMQLAGSGQYGQSYEVAPMTTYKVLNQQTCFLINGTQGGAITVQSVLPDMTDFTFAGKSMVRGQTCDMMEKVEIKGHKKNKYTVCVQMQDGNAVPLEYVMMGYDTLLGSHYDKYVIDYMDFQPSAKIPPQVFTPPANLTCGDFPGPGAKGKEHHILMNPMREYIHNYDDHHIEMFQAFKTKHNPVYKTDLEHAQRLHNFRQNVRFIHSTNRKGLTYSLGVNHLADKTHKELRGMNGFHYTPGDHGGLPFDLKVDVKDLPPDFDWRLHGAVTPVKDQAVCGSCWSFGTAECIEGAYFLKKNNLVRLSQQMLMDCSWGEGNNACDGGEDFRAYQWIMKNGGLATEEDYGPYLGQDSYCRAKEVNTTVNLKGYVNITQYDQAALKFALVHQGPISVAIDASHLSLSFYANGVYYEPDCGNKPDDLDHAVLAVGYGTLQGEDYWLIKNSWSTYWGNDGYVLMSMKDNNCGVATDATYVIIAD